MFSFYNDITFAEPHLLWLLSIIPLLGIWYWWLIKKGTATMRFSSTAALQGIKPSTKIYLRHFLFVLRCGGIAFMILALARPQSRSSWKNIETEGIDIVLAIDISASMLAQDFKPNRLEASKEVAMDFINSRPNDRIGLVIFSGESFTQCPLTTDHAVIKNLFSAIKTGMIADGTAIGMGLANAVNRIKDSNAKSKVVVLLTDGVNNVGSIAPLTAGEIAKAYGIRVYTIGVGTIGKALSPVALYPNGQFEFDYVDVKIDEDVLTKIAEMTGGKYFRATNKQKLKNIYTEIDRLEKTVIQETNFTNKEERFLAFALIAGILLATENILRYTFLKTLP